VPEHSAEDHEERLAWMALTLTPGLGPRRILQAVERVGAALRVIKLPLTQLEGQRFPAPAVQYISGGEAWKAAQEQSARLREMGASFLTFAEEAYPEGLREIYDPPPVLCTGARPRCSGDRRWQLSARASRAPTGRAWQSCSPATSRCAGW
jgi:predicted Rossmann fold nucleotide-binding protein DprA/Smf involved in DNA uptake